MDPADYQRWEDAQTAKLAVIEQGIASLRQGLTTTKDRLALVRTGVAAEKDASVLLESTGGPLVQSHGDLRLALAHLVARSLSIEVVVSAPTFIAQLPNIAIPAQVIQLPHGDRLLVTQTGPLTVKFPNSGGPFAEGPDRLHAEVPVQAVRGSKVYSSTLKICIELHRQAESLLTVILATRPALDPMPTLSGLLLARIQRSLSSSLSSVFPISLFIPIPPIGSLPSLSLYASRCDQLPRFYVSAGRRARYTLGFLAQLPPNTDRAYNIDTNLFRDVITRQLQARGVSLGTPITSYPADNAMVFDAYVEGGTRGKVEVRDPIFGLCIVCFDWGIRGRVTVPVKVWFRQRSPQVVEAESRRNGGYRFDILNQFPGNIIQLLPEYWVVKAALEEGLNRGIGPSIEQDYEAFSDGGAANVDFTLSDPQTLIGIRY